MKFLHSCKTATYIQYLLILAAAAINNATACSSAPETFFLNPEQMFMHANGVALAKAVSVKKPKEPMHIRELQEYSFEVNEFYANPYNGTKSAPKAITLPGFPATEGGTTDFSAHDDISFWGSSFRGNNIMPGDCNAYGTYELGKTYLIFIDLSHPKAFEMIQSSDDRWHKVVKFIAK